MRIKLSSRFCDTVKPPAVGQSDYFDTQRPGLGLRVSQGGQRSWCVVYKVAGRMRRLTLGKYPTLALVDARKLAAAALRDVQLGTDPADAKIEARGADTFAKLTALYLELHAKPNKRTWREDERLIDRELLPSWRHRRAADIARRDVIALLDGVVERGSPVAANRIKALISKVFNFAIRRGICEANPAYLVGNPGGAEQRRDRVLSEDEIRAVWQALDSESPTIAAIYRLGLLTAQRKGEVTGMLWAEVDVTAGIWTIAAERSKNRLSHRVPLVGAALHLLRDLKAAATDDARFVFPGGKGGIPLSNLQKPAVRLKERSKVDFRYHDLRRSAASHMTSIGIQRLVVSKILNHAEPGITAVYDRHSYDAEKQSALSRWDRHLKRILEADSARKVVAING